MFSFTSSSIAFAIISVIVVLLGVWIWFRLRFREIIKVATKLPYMSQPFPFIGHGLYILLGTEYAMNVYLNHSEEAAAKGHGAFCFWAGPFPIITVNNLDDVKKIMTSSRTAEKSDEYSFFKIGLGNGLFTAPNDIWRVTRKYMNPLFHSRNLEFMLPVFNRHSRTLVQKLEKSEGGNPVDVIHLVRDSSLRSVLYLIYGVDYPWKTSSKEFLHMKDLMQSVSGLTFKRIFKIWLRNDFLYTIFCKKEIKMFHSWLEDVASATTQVTMKIKEDENQNLESGHHEEDDENTVSSPKRILSLLDQYRVLQSDYPQFTDLDRQMEINATYAGGTDTVGVSTSTLLLLLAKHQNIQELVYKEISSVVDEDRDVTLEDISLMPYLDQVYKETLRWATTVPIMARRTTQEIELSSCTIPAGYTVVVGLGAIHMNPNIYPDPSKFDPERFSPENCAQREKYAFIPFSAGSRNCIGKKYAELFVKITAVQVLRRFRLTTKLDLLNTRKVMSAALLTFENYLISVHSRS